MTTNSQSPMTTLTQTPKLFDTPLDILRGKAEKLTEELLDHFSNSGYVKKGSLTRKVNSITKEALKIDADAFNKKGGIYKTIKYYTHCTKSNTKKASKDDLTPKTVFFLKLMLDSYISNGLNIRQEHLNDYIRDEWYDYLRFYVKSKTDQEKLYQWGWKNSPPRYLNDFCDKLINFKFKINFLDLVLQGLPPKPVLQTNMYEEYINNNYFGDNDDILENIYSGKLFEILDRFDSKERDLRDIKEKNGEVLNFSEMFKLDEVKLRHIKKEIAQYYIKKFRIYNFEFNGEIQYIALLDELLKRDSEFNKIFLESVKTGDYMEKIQGVWHDVLLRNIDYFFLNRNNCFRESLPELETFLECDTSYSVIRKLGLENLKSLSSMLSKESYLSGDGFLDSFKKVFLEIIPSTFNSFSSFHKGELFNLYDDIEKKLCDYFSDIVENMTFNDFTSNTDYDPQLDLFVESLNNLVELQFELSYKNEVLKSYKTKFDSKLVIENKKTKSQNLLKEYLSDISLERFYRLMKEGFKMSHQLSFVDYYSEDNIKNIWNPLIISLVSNKYPDVGEKLNSLDNLFHPFLLEYFMVLIERTDVPTPILNNFLINLSQQELIKTNYSAGYQFKGNFLNNYDEQAKELLLSFLDNYLIFNPVEEKEKRIVVKEKPTLKTKTLENTEYMMDCEVYNETCEITDEEKEELKMKFSCYDFYDDIVEELGIDPLDLLKFHRDSNGKLTHISTDGDIEFKDCELTRLFKIKTNLSIKFEFDLWHYVFDQFNKWGGIRKLRKEKIVPQKLLK